MQLKFAPDEYIMQLFRAGRTKKARAALEYSFFSEHGIYQSGAAWAKSWNVSRSTAWHWCQEFEEETDKHCQAVQASYALH